MGNCLKHQRAATWVDEDDYGGGDDYWGSEEPARSAAGKENKYFEGSSRVKIRITKKELNVLLEKADKGKLSAQDVVEKLVRMGSVSLEHQERHWRPTLQSIPEVAE